MARLFRSKRTTIWLAIAGLVVLLLVAGGGSYVAVNAGGSPAPTPTTQPTASPSSTPVAPTATLSPTATAQPTATATDTPPPPATATSAPPPATATSEPAPKPTRTIGPVEPPVSCPNRGHNHLNVERLREQPGLEQATITEIDSSRIRVEIQGYELIITGWGDDIGIGGNAPSSGEPVTTVERAVDAVRFDC